MTDERLNQALDILRDWRTHLDADVEDAIETVIAVFEAAHAQNAPDPAKSDIPAGEMSLNAHAPTGDERARVIEDMLRYHLLPNAVIEYLNGYLETLRSEAPVEQRDE